MESNKKIIRVNLMVIIISIAIITMAVIGIIKVLKHEETEIVEINEYATDYIETHDISEVFYDNGWVKEYISDIKEEIPIPNGYEYVQGEKNTGFVIKDKNNNYYMWIPYNENAEVKDIDKYYKKVTNNGDIDYNNYKSIEIYDGFYVLLTKEKNDYNELKNIDDKSYNKLQKELSKESDESEAIDIGLISKFELEQVLYFTQNNNISSLKVSNNNTSYKITKLSNENNNSNSEENNIWYTATTAIKLNSWNGKQQEKYTKFYGYTKWQYTDLKGKKRTAFLPDGFEFMIDGGYLKIRSVNNSNLKFVWVSVEDYMDESSNETAAEQIRKELLKLFSQSGTDVQYALEDEEVILNNDTDYSIKKFKGFYMASTATKILNDGTISTTEDATKNFKPANGDYIRMTSNYNIQSWYVYINDLANNVNEEINKELREDGKENDKEVVATEVAYTSIYEALFTTIGKDEKLEMLYEDAYQENAGTIKSNPENVEMGKEPVNGGVTGINGRVGETTGNQDDSGNVTYNTNGEGEEVVDMSAINYTTSTNISTMSTITMDKVSASDVRTGESGKYGFRLAMFISDVNRHAQYFDYIGNGEIKLKDNVIVPEELMIPRQILDSDGNGVYVEHVKCTGNEKIKKVIDKVSYTVTESAYENCSNLESIEIKYANIGKRAFANCKSLSEINIEEVLEYKEGVEYAIAEDEWIIGSEAFLNCVALKKFIAGNVEEEECKITTAPNKLVYFKEENLDLSGGVLTVTYNNGTVNNIDLSTDNPNLKISGWNDTSGTGYEDGIKYKEKTLTLTYGKVSTTIKVYIVSEFNKKEFLWGNLSRAKTQYNLNEKFSYDGIVARYIYEKDGYEITKIIDFGNKEVKKYVNREEKKDEKLKDEAEFWSSFIKLTGYNKMSEGNQNVTLSLGEQGRIVNEVNTFTIEVKSIGIQTNKESENKQMPNSKGNEENAKMSVKQVQDSQVRLKYGKLQKYDTVYGNAFSGCNNIEQILIGDIRYLYMKENKDEFSDESDDKALMKIESVFEGIGSPKGLILKIGNRTYQQSTEQVETQTGKETDNTKSAGDTDGQQSSQGTDTSNGEESSSGGTFTGGGGSSDGGMLPGGEGFPGGRTPQGEGNP